MNSYYTFTILLMLTIMLASNTTAATEYEIDLHLTDMSLKRGVYNSNVKDTDKTTIRFEGVERSYFSFFPQKIENSTPILVALHAAGRTGASMVDTWRKNAEKHLFIVVAPNGLNKNWDINVDNANFFLAVMADALVKRKIKSNNIYLFGHSNGAKQAIALTARHPGMFHRVAVHAGTLPFSFKEETSRNSPQNVRLAMFLGDRDHIFSLESGRKTVNALSSIGIESTLYVLKNHTHWYYNDANRINESVWSFLNKT